MWGTFECSAGRRQRFQICWGWKSQLESCWMWSSGIQPRFSTRVVCALNCCSPPIFLEFSYCHCALVKTAASLSLVVTLFMKKRPLDTSGAFFGSAHFPLSLLLLFYSFLRFPLPLIESVTLGSMVPLLQNFQHCCWVLTAPSGRVWEEQQTHLLSYGRNLIYPPQYSGFWWIDIVVAPRWLGTSGPLQHQVDSRLAPLTQPGKP